MNVVLAVVAIAAVSGAGEVLVRRVHMSAELARKLVHAGSAAVAALLPLLVTYSQIVVIALAFAGVMVVVHRFRLLAALAGVQRASYGEVWFPLGIAALAALFPRDAAYVYGTLVLGFADASAALVGAHFGRRRLPFTGGKTFLGSTVFWATAVAVGVAVAGVLSLEVVAVAAALAVAEALASRGTDNVVVPVLAGLLATQVWR